MNRHALLPTFAFLVVISGTLANAQTTTISAPAQVEPYERAELFAKASGFVSTVKVDIGDVVKQGQLLAELSIPEMQRELLQKQALLDQSRAAISQSEAGVASARAKIVAAKARVTAAESQVAAANAQLEKHKADIAFAQSELSRITTLVSSRAVNASMQDEKQQQLRAAKAALASAEADIQSAQSQSLAVKSGVQVAEADLKQAEADLIYAQSQSKVAEAVLAHTQALMEYAKIKAPFDGRISQRGVDTGDFVISAASAKTMGASLFTLNRIGRFRIVFNVPESSATHVQIGQKVELKVDSVKEGSFTGEIKRTAGELDKRTRTLRVEAEVTDDKSQLRPGMYGTISVTVGGIRVYLGEGVKDHSGRGNAR
ncbi:MAG: efflux RND transporter periplasmic adaptor subunit [Planctomycetota bacterium]|nr:efflux RND transporter periplasmic adaptor subunit [Planctomycetota bacterium]MDA1178571.1 efflux RND transporter periplasmic adaptor subunit [Planctomycetota bacterium]